MQKDVNGLEIFNKSNPTRPGAKINVAKFQNFKLKVETLTRIRPDPRDTRRDFIFNAYPTQPPLMLFFLGRGVASPLQVPTFHLSTNRLGFPPLQIPTGTWLSTAPNPNRLGFPPLQIITGIPVGPMAVESWFNACFFFSLSSCQDKK